MFRFKNQGLYFQQVAPEFRSNFFQPASAIVKTKYPCKSLLL
ncbi:Uncharacterized protein dnm_054000 [Desulfonema magnum]|uniref:Uncharacterized protein n=1 Tax=Desulfonema magnum TaxID=45655 RepID=A0A975BQR9_9BACT|nr:Uncharacterized protein dnm_054000 [Desulfonema magnum]